jgi:hypothetical protein
MQNSVSGDVRDNGTVLQVHQVNGDILVGRRRPRRPGSLARPVLLAILLVCVQQYGLSALGDGVVPAGETIRPLGADGSAAIRAVAVKLRHCAGEVVAAPVNCPQRAPAPPDARVSGWELVSRATDGMRVAWHDGRFRVAGSAAMRLEYFTGGVQRLVLSTFRFTTEVRWRGEQTSVRDVGPIVAGGPGSAPKLGFDLSPRVVADEVRAAFAACVAAGNAPVPGTCPHTITERERRDTRWKLDTDPMVNPVVEPDAEYGLVRVTSSYSVALHEPIGKARSPLATHSGTYVATLVRIDDGSAQLLEIRHVP